MRPIFVSLSPNVEKDDIFLALKLIFRPGKWKRGNVIGKIEREFERCLGAKYAISFNSGRSAFLAILKSLNLEEGSEVLLQAFTCNATVNPIIWMSLKPVFVDIKKETLNIDPVDLEAKITRKSKALLVQHTFGLPINLDEILEICKKHDLILIEDCAHSLGATYRGKEIGLPTEALAKVGTFGKASFFSFGRDKVISSVYGGMAATNDVGLAKKIKDFQKECDFPSHFWIFQQLLHPIFTNFLIIPLYNFFEFGRWILLFFQKTKVLSKAVHEKEKKGKKPGYFPQKMPNALAILAENQLKKLERFISHQRKIANIYGKGLKDLGFLLPKKDPERIYMRYPILIENYDTDEILKKARKKKIFLDDGWRKTLVVPPDTDQTKMGYVLGTCPVAERVAENILNLPVHINISEGNARKIIDFLKAIFSENFKEPN